MMRCRIIPADRVADLHRRARAIRLVARRIGAVEQHPVLHVDQTGEHQLGQHLLAVRHVLHQPEERAVGVDHLAAMYQREPVGQALLQWAVLTQRLLVRPIDHWLRRLIDRAEIAAGARIVAGRLVHLLVPDIEAARDVPDRLRHRQHRQPLRHHLRQIDRCARAQQAMVVVDEVRIAVVDALMVWHMRVGRMDTHTLGDDLPQRTPGTHEIVIDLACPHLVARHNPLFQRGVESTRGAVDLHVHCRYPPATCWLILSLTGRFRQPWWP